MDTDFLIELARGSAPALRRAEQLARRPEQAVKVPSVVWVEFFAGLDPGRRDLARKTLLAGADLVPFDAARAEEAVVLHDLLLEKGRRLGWSDLQVASTARSLGEPLVSNDQAFRRVPGLEVWPF